jgi:hypothetical protein
MRHLQGKGESAIINISMGLRLVEDTSARMPVPLALDSVL